jgi:uridine monophosphate synthetase
MSFFSRLEFRIRAVNSLLCVGLDPHPGDLPVFTGEAAGDFCLRLIDSTLEIAAAYKPNAAFFEALGPEGVGALVEVIAAVPDEIPVILDAKRGDIASTARAYSQSVFETLGADAVTINPYLGFDALEPFLEDPEKGVFLLCKTSNPGASVLQDLVLMGYWGSGMEAQGSKVETKTGSRLYEYVARLAQNWNTRDNLGLVVGATQPDSLARIRSVAPDLWILAPGIGAQGGDLGSALRSGLRADGLGILFPVSRGISRADDPRQAAHEIRDAINRQKVGISSQFGGISRNPLPADPRYPGGKLAKIADGLLEAGCIKFGRFTLKSGLESPIYVDLRRLVGFPQLLSEVALAYIQILNDLKFDHLGALPYAALPIASAISLQSGWSMIYPRKEVKSYGTSAQIEGVFQAGETIVVIDDLISTGGSKLEGIEKLKSAGLDVQDVVVLIDRSPDGGVELHQAGYTLHAVLTLAKILNHYECKGSVPQADIDAARSFLLR